MFEDLASARIILARTPETLRVWLSNLPEAYVRAREGEGTFSAFDVVGHLIEGEKTDWIPRAITILERGKSETFEPFDRFGQIKASQGKTIEELLDEFAALRAENLGKLDELDLQPEQLALMGRHPDFGLVSLGELIATWVAHDLGHIAQIARVMAKRHADDVGPWRAYLPVLGPRQA